MCSHVVISTGTESDALLIVQNERSSIGDLLYRNMASDNFSAEVFLSTLDTSDEHNILDVANQLETAMLIIREQTHLKQEQLWGKETKFNPKAAWGKIREFVGDVDRRVLLADRAESVLVGLKQRVPGLPQTTLDTNKIQFNRVGMSEELCELLTKLWIVAVHFYENEAARNAYNMYSFSLTVTTLLWTGCRISANQYWRVIHVFLKVWLSTSSHELMMFSMLMTKLFAHYYHQSHQEEIALQTHILLTIDPTVLPTHSWQLIALLMPLPFCLLVHLLLDPMWHPAHLMRTQRGLEL